jgi:hypothetical protein
MAKLIAGLKQVARAVLSRRVPHAFEGLSAKTRALAIDELLIILSFDCDTPGDAVAAQALDAQLVRRGIARSYAVPGQMLLAAAASYRSLVQNGAGFLNHGGRTHAEQQGDRYHAVTFYDQMTSDDVVADMHEGHRIVSDVVGVAPRGFRAPHFGSFQQPAQRKLVYDTARSLGYRFCSDTLPASAYAHGPVFDVGGLYEFPLTGSRKDPNVILDSWNYLENRVDYRLSKDFFVRFAATVDFFADRRLPALLNFYVDPSHVANDSHFLDAIDHAIDRGARFASFDDVLARIGGGPK